MSFADLRNRAAILLLALAVIGFLAPAARAQQVAVAQIDGYVTDPSGQAIAGAQVKATEVDRDQVHTGHHRCHRPLSSSPTCRSAIISSKSLLRVSRTYVQKGIVLDAGNNRTQSVTLEVGAVTESVEVTANAAQVETKENSISQVVDSERIVDLPLNGRNPDRAAGHLRLRHQHA